MPVLSSLFDRIRTVGSNVTLVEPDRRWAGFAQANNDQAALTFSAVYAAVTLIADAIAAMPVHVYRKRRDGSSEPVSSGTYDYLLKQPNPEVPSFTFWQTVMGHKVLTGNAYLWVEKFDNGLPRYLWPIEPHRVMVGREPTGRRRKIYRVGNEPPMIDYAEGGEIVHLMNLPWDGSIGMSPIQKAAQALQLAGTARQYSTQLLDEGARPSGLLTTEAKLGAALSKELGETWDRLHSGDRRGRTAVLSEGTKWQQVSISPVDAQLMEILKWGVTDVARWFRVPPHLIGDVERSTSWGTGIAESNQIFFQLTLSPHLIPIEQTITNALLGGGATYMRFNAGGLLRGSVKEQYEAHRIALGNQPFMTQDEVRELLEMPPQGGKAAELGTSVGGAPPTVTPPIATPAPKAQEPTETQLMARAFIEGDSYAQIAIRFGLEGADPEEAVKKRIQRYFREEQGLTPSAARRQSA